MFRTVCQTSLMGFSEDATDTFCVPWRTHNTTQFEGLSSSILVCTVDFILAFRVWILYEKSRKILWFLIVIVSDTTGSHIFSFYPTPMVIVSFVMFLMTLYRCLFWNRMKTPIFSLFLRDGVFWFLAVLLVIVPEIVTGALSRDSRALSELMALPTLAVFCLIGSRVLLNIKTFLANTEVIGTTNTRGTFGDRVTEFRAATRDIGSTMADIIN
ncbi:hypothetical protein BD779DRAFT_1476630 [Infundibulicybe gibba]|nr:hypothetical protein BD779DRAFT_1476630 [Infundibulicybe gibba]